MNTCPLHNSCFLKHLTRCLKTLHTVIVYPLHCKKMEEQNDNDKYEYVHLHRCMTSGPPTFIHPDLLEKPWQEPHVVRSTSGSWTRQPPNLCLSLPSILLLLSCLFNKYGLSATSALVQLLNWVVDNVVKGTHSLHWTITTLTTTLSTSEVPYLITITGGGN